MHLIKAKKNGFVFFFLFRFSLSQSQYVPIHSVRRAASLSKTRAPWHRQCVERMLWGDVGQGAPASQGIDLALFLIK